MDYQSCPNLVAMFFEQADRLGDKPFLWVKRDGAYLPLTWRETADRVARLAGGLSALGVKAGERIVLLSENRPEWMIADMAIMAAGAITVPAYTTNTQADHQHLIGDSGARGAILSTSKLAERFLPAAHLSDELTFLIAMEPLLPYM